MSPRRQFIVGSHFRAIPVFCERGQAAAQIVRLRLVDSAFTEVDRVRSANPGHDNARALGFVQWLRQVVADLQGRVSPRAL